MQSISLFCTLHSWRTRSFCTQGLAVTSHQMQPRGQGILGRFHLRKRPVLRRDLSRRRQLSAPSSVRAGLQCSSFFETNESSDEVTKWLEALGMHEYIPAFKDQDVNRDTLLSLNSVELRKNLGVKKLKDRRVILEGISYLAQAICSDTKKILPEDGRILTHLSNERIFLQWIRFGVILLTFALATLRLTNLEDDSNRANVQAVSGSAATSAILAVGYGTFRYYWMHRMIENPGRDYLPGNNSVAMPLLVVVVGVTVALYIAMSESTEEAAMLALLSI